MLDDTDKRILLAALGFVSLEAHGLKPHEKAVITRAAGIVQRKVVVRRRLAPPACQLSLELTFRRLPPGVKRRGRVRWAKYEFRLVEEARRLRSEKRWTYRDIAEFINAREGTNIPWITIRDWTSQYYRVTG